MDADDPRLIYMPEDEVLKAAGICEALHNRWYCFHPERGLIFFQHDTRKGRSLTSATPQCNGVEAIAHDICCKLYPWAEVRHVPLVLVKRRPQDYVA
jgi:hypothetical protein